MARSTALNVFVSIQENCQASRRPPYAEGVLTRSFEAERSEQLRTQPEVTEDHIAEQHYQLEHLNGWEREDLYWRIQERERKLRRSLEMLEESEFACSMYEDIGKLGGLYAEQI
jgi:hypothetical protein